MKRSSTAESFIQNFTMKEQRTAHALLLPVPFQGHINPFMQLGDRLASLGVRVTLVTTQRLHAQILGSQEALSQPITARHAHFKLLGVPDGLPDPPHSPPQVVEAVEKLEDPVLELVHTLAAQGFPVTCIVSDYFLRWSPSLASRTSLPEYIFWPQCASMLAIYLHIDNLAAAGYDLFSTSEKPAAIGPDPMDMVGCIPSISHLEIRNADLPCQGRFWTSGHKKLIRHRQEHLPRARGLLINSFEGLEGEVSRALTVELQHLITHPASSIRSIGPLTASTREGSGTSLWEEEVDCIEWLDGQPTGTVIFVAFGSVATMTCKEQVQELARGLAESGHRFLWVLRRDAIDVLDGEVAMKIEDALPYGFLEEVQGKGKVVNWAPQVRVLSHRAVGGFFSHCGWNSTLESISAGVPILGWPYFVDQITNCRLISHVWGIGMELQRNSSNETNRVKVATGVKELMQGPHAQIMHARAIKLKNLANEAVLSLQELMSFVSDIDKF